MGMPVRLKDIAQDLKLSVVTVSKVLRDHPDIGPETRERVLKELTPRVLEVSIVVGACARRSCSGCSMGLLPTQN